MYRHTVLVVEDEPLIRMVLAAALEDRGYAVAEAGTVLEAIAALASRDIDGVITDIDMPGGSSGLDLARLIASSMNDLPVIITSGGHALADDDLPHGARFVSKPYNLERILELLNEMTSAQELGQSASIVVHAA